MGRFYYYFFLNKIQTKTCKLYYLLHFGDIVSIWKIRATPISLLLPERIRKVESDCKDGHEVRREELGEGIRQTDEGGEELEHRSRDLFGRRNFSEV